MTVPVAMDSISSTHFLKWVWFLDWKATEEFDRRDYYDAQIAVAIERGMVKNPRAVTIKKRLIRFTRKADSKDDGQARMQKSKNFWMGAIQANIQKRRLPKRK